MKSLGRFLLLILLIITGIYFYQKSEERKRLKKEEEEREAEKKEQKRKELFDYYTALLAEIRMAVLAFEINLRSENGYFSNHNYTKWKNQFVELHNSIKKYSYENIKLPEVNVGVINTFISYFDKGSLHKDAFNKTFVKEELGRYSAFFNNIETKQLDHQQRTAVVTDEDNNIVIAGAGSGKTLTIVGKVNYIIDRYKIRPEDILLISFTNKSATTLAERIKSNGVEAKTFHKFGKDIIVKVEGKQPSIFDEAQFKPQITKYFNELIADRKYLGLVTKYFTDFMKEPKSQFDFKNQGDYIQFIKDQNFRTYKQKEIPTNGKKTYKMEVVKSVEECKIANFLLFNGIEYEYEFPYIHETATEAFRQYKPDFTIKQNNKTIYLEHCAVGRNGNVPPFFTQPNETPEMAKQRYWEKINWARELHKTYNTKIIESYSYEMQEDILFENLKNNLENEGVKLTPKSPEEIWNIIKESANDEIAQFINLFQTFINLLKSNNYSIDYVITKAKLNTSEFERKRNLLFIEIIKPIYDKYQLYLAERKEIDFSDMINKATGYILNGNYKKNFKYVIIDEFQDISIGRYQLIKAFKKTNPECKLFCVGDDWQSIYRFSGSDIALFKEFEKFFGVTVKSKIETTYRFHNPLLSMSSGFIQKNPNQEKKDLKTGMLNLNTKFEIRYSEGDQDDTEALKQIFEELIEGTPSIEKKEILILGRYGFDINRIKNENKVFTITPDGIISYCKTKDDNTKVNVNAKFMTVHKAKGLEADVVAILNCNSGRHGFPSELSDDKVLNLLLSEADQFENGEERRLFYVAMTRAKELIYFISDISYKSKFIAELETTAGMSKNKKCPVCATSDLIVRKQGTAKNGNTYKFYGCTNYLYGCEFNVMDWQNN
jgi:DNA helicase-4